MLLTTADFKCEASIPGLLPDSDSASPMNEVVRETVERYIEKYEPQFLREFLTEDKFNEFEEYAALPECEQDDTEMNSLLGRLRFSLAHYVAFHLFRTQTNTLIGGVQLGSENGSRVSTSDTQVTLWNQMVANNRTLYIDIFSEDYPNPRHNELFHYINKWNI